MTTEPYDHSQNNAQADRPMALWGGRFSGGPSEALAALSVSTQFDWRASLWLGLLLTAPRSSSQTSPLETLIRILQWAS